MHPGSASTSTAAGTTVLRLTGDDALGVLHRISTQALLDLPVGQARATLFCDFRGRLLHRAVVAHARDRAVWLLRDDAPGAELMAHVDRHVFRERVAIEPPSDGWVVRLALGGFGHPPGQVEERHGVPATVQLEWNFGWSLQPTGTAVDPAAEVDRISAGRARHGHEIAEAFTPYEVGLAHEVHLSKGCYTGQEVLLRLVTYRSVRRSLALASGEGPVPRVPEDLHAGDDRLGVVTSAVARGDGWIGLAVVRRDALEAGAVATLAGDRAVALTTPFPQTTPQGLP